MSTVGSFFQIGGTVVGSVFGAPEAGGQIGTMLGSALGSDKNIFTGDNPRQYGQRLGGSNLLVAKEGEPIPRVYGTHKLGGQLIWCTQFKENTTVTKQSAKGGGSVKQVNYSYSVSLAVGLCEGVVDGFGRIWVDNNPLDVTYKNIRFYKGTEDQLADSKISATEGAEFAPAFRGLAYMVIEDLDLTPYGNRIPQIAVEVTRSLKVDEDIENKIKAVTLIPASGEFSLAPFKVAVWPDSVWGDAPQAIVNVNNSIGQPDVVTALDQLQEALPNVESVSIVVAWFGDDLRAGECIIDPRVETGGLVEVIGDDREIVLRLAPGTEYIIKNLENAVLDIIACNDNETVCFTSALDNLGSDRFGPVTGELLGYSQLDIERGYIVRLKIDPSSVSQTWSIEMVHTVHASPAPWAVAGKYRAQVRAVTLDANGRPVYGGTPSDLSVYELIKECKDRGLRVTFYPFVLMDIPETNGLDDPYGGAEQAPFPWRGRITCHPAIGEVGTVDKTSTATAQVNAFFGDANIDYFGEFDGVSIVYSDDEAPFTYSRMIYHYAHLCQDAGGVDAFVIGSELVGLTRVRGASNSFPAVDKLIDIATDVKGLLGVDTDITYAADWSEYHSYRPSDGSNDVYFNLDPLWSNSNIDAIGIDNYMPLSDWREGGLHADLVAGAKSIYDLDYLKDNVEGGEGYDWFYASSADRDSQTRTPIVDSAHSEHWVFRQKDLKNWWLNPHYNRPAGLKGGQLPSEFGLLNGSMTINSIIEEGGFQRINATLAYDNTAGGSSVTTAFRTTSASSPAATTGQSWEASFTGKIVSTTHPVSFTIDERNASFTSVASTSVTLNTTEQTFTASRTFNNATTTKASMRIGRTVAAGQNFSCTFEMKIPTLKQTSGANQLDPDLGGVVTGQVGASLNATAWTPQSKPIWFTEFGCPAVDKGTNQPNVFYDPKSSESAFPYYSTGYPDDYIQRQYLTAVQAYWADVVNNPVSSVYSDSMIDLDNCAVWTWDARPFPDFPARLSVWSDGDNYNLGHWIQGRLGQYAQLYRVVEDLCLQVGLTPDVESLKAFPFVFRGFSYSGVVAPLDALRSLMATYQIVASEDGGQLIFKLKSDIKDPIIIDSGDLLLQGSSPAISTSQSQADDIPTDVVLDYISSAKDYEGVSVRSGDGLVTGRNVHTMSSPFVLDARYANHLAHSTYNEMRMHNRRVTIKLPLKYAYLLPNDIVQLTHNGVTSNYRVTDLSIGSSVDVQMISVTHNLYSSRGFGSITESLTRVKPAGIVRAMFVDLPLLTEDQTDTNPRVAMYQAPWQIESHVYKVIGDVVTLNAVVDSPSTMGLTVSPLYAGPTDIWDYANELIIEVQGQTLESRSEFQVSQGANALAIEHLAGEWEIIQFVNAELLTASRFKLTKLRRGLLGTEGAMLTPAGVGSNVLVIDPYSQPHLVSARNASQTFKYGPSSEPFSDISYRQTTLTFKHVALRPYSPVDVRYSVAGGDITFTWIRRSRTAGKTWSYVTLPLGEDTELYEVDIYDGSDVVRTVTSTSPSFVYTVAQQTTDFGSPPSSFTGVVYQISSVYGRGQGRNFEYNA